MVSVSRGSTPCRAAASWHHCGSLPAFRACLPDTVFTRALGRAYIEYQYYVDNRIAGLIRVWSAGWYDRTTHPQEHRYDPKKLAANVT